MSAIICPQCEKPTRTENEPADGRPIRQRGDGTCARCYKRERREQVWASVPDWTGADLPAGIPDWTEARCRTTGGDAMFPDRGDREGIAAAKALCASCPLAATCLAYAMREERGHGYAYRAGIYGGLTPYERARLERRKEAVA